MPSVPGELLKRIREIPPRGHALFYPRDFSETSLRRLAGRIFSLAHGLHRGQYTGLTADDYVYLKRIE